jgi:hypothetical protein
MPIYLRQFYYNLLVEFKSKEAGSTSGKKTGSTTIKPPFKPRNK